MRKSVEIKLFISIELDRRLDQFVEGTRPGVILAEGDVVEDIEGLVGRLTEFKRSHKETDVTEFEQH